MNTQGGPSRTAYAVARAVVTVALLLFTLLVASPDARAHAELRQSSPGADETVGGEFHQIAMHFTGLDPAATQQARLFDPAGNLVTEDPAQEGQRLVLGIEPLTLPGEYTVIYEVNGIDGDFTTESFSFRYDPEADEPAGIKLAIADDDGFDLINFGLLLVGAGLLAMLVHRFVNAVRDHRAAQTEPV